METRIVLVTCSGREQTESIARTLVEQRHAACVNILPGLISHYWWDGKVQRDEEYLMVIKTGRDNVKRLERAVYDLHPYDTAEFVVLEPEYVGKRYERWLLGAMEAG